MPSGRRFGLLERIFLGLEPFFPVNFCLTVKVAGHPPLEELQRSANSVCEVFPVLGAARTSGRLPELEARVRPAVPVRELGAATDAGQSLLEGLTTPFGPADPNFRITVQYGPANSVLVFTFAHFAADGKSAVLAVRAFLAALGNGSAPSQSRRFPPPLEDAAPAAWKSPSLGSLAQFAIATARWPVFLLSDSSGTRPGLQRRALNPELAQALLARCRQEKATVHGALVAAALLAVSAENAKATCLSPIDLRDQLGPDFRDQVGLYMGVALTRHRVRGTAFWALARDATLQVRDCRLNPKRRALDLFLERRVVGVPALSTPSIYANVFVTNLGSVELGGPAPLELGFVLTPRLIGPGMLVAAASHAGTLSLSFGHNEPLTRETTAAERVETAMNWLTRAAAGTAG